MYGNILTKEFLENCYDLGKSSSDISRDLHINARTIRWYMKKHKVSVLQGKSHTPWSKGVKYKDNEKIRKALDSAHSARRGVKPWNFGLKLPPHTEEHKKKQSDALRGKYTGPLCSSWRGGVTPINKIIRRSAEYKRWRKSVFERDNYTCLFCEKRGGELHPDHIKQFAYYPDLRFEISNGRTLCADCHRKTPTWGNSGKSLPSNNAVEG